MNKILQKSVLIDAPSHAVTARLPLPLPFSSPTRVFPLEDKLARCTNWSVYPRLARAAVLGFLLNIVF